MDDDDEIVITIDEIKPGKPKSGFYLSEQPNTINDNDNDNDASEQLIESKENNNKKECIFCTFNLNGWFSIINLVTGALGTGVLAFPSIVYYIGIANGMICFIVVALSNYFSLDLLRRFVVDTKLFSYATITNSTLGFFWLIMYAISSFIIYMMSIACYLKLLYKISVSLISGIGDKFVAKFFYFL
jgi:hypothetical protein